MKRLLLTTVCALVGGAAWAEYPEKPVTIVVPFAAGGPTDKVARDLAEAMRKPMGGQTIIIENVGGAGGTLGAGKVAKASNDGYTLLLHHIGMSTSPALYRNMAYKTLDDFEFLVMSTLTALMNSRPHRCEAAPRPALARLILPLLASIHFISSAMLLAGKVGLPIKVIGTSLTMPRNSKSSSVL